MDFAFSNNNKKLFKSMEINSFHFRLTKEKDNVDEKHHKQK